jgi:predicted small metal-binding protein
MKVVDCPCGTQVEGESDEQLVANVQQHISDDHPEMVGTYSSEQILEMAHEHA